jgi:hypothetical protein
MNVLSFEAFASLEVINSIELWEDLFKGYLLGPGQNVFCSRLRRFLLALSGPAYILPRVKDSVKDTSVYNCE